MAATVAVLALVVPGIASAATSDGAERYTCWAAPLPSDDRETPGREVVCRIAGSRLGDFAERSDAPVLLHPAVGSDEAGECWYWSNAPSRWVLVVSDGSTALLRLDVGDPGGLVVADGWVRACGGEPAPATAPIELVWEIVRAFTFPVPAARIDPVVGIAGLATFVALDVPGPVARSVTSPETGSRISVDIAVEAVEVDWGDGGAPSLVARGLFPTLDGAPDGTLHHVYEASGRYGITLSYRWEVSWSVDGGPARDLTTAPSPAIVEYPVDELVSRRI